MNNLVKALCHIKSVNEDVVTLGWYSLVQFFGTVNTKSIWLQIMNLNTVLIKSRIVKNYAKMREASTSL